MLPHYLPYLDALLGVVMPAKKPAKKPTKKLAKLALKSTPATLTSSAAPPAGSTRSISNTHAYSRTAGVAPEFSATNKCKKLFTPSPPGLPKPS